MRIIHVGTRQSQLAVAQTEQLVQQLEQVCAKNGLDYQFKIHKIVTKGDRILDVTLSKIGGKGLFVKEIEQSMLDGTIDIAVHSMKDMPATLPEGLIIGAIPVREDARDCMISGQAQRLEDLQEGAIVGTSSLRRASQMKAYRPDLEMKWIRGNIDSRIRKLTDGEYDAIILAAAGLHRMGWKAKITQYLPMTTCLPAVGQGALAIQCRQSDHDIRQLIQRLEHAETALAVRAERAYLARLGGSCQVPVGAFASVEQSVIRLQGMVGSPDGSQVLFEAIEGTEPEVIGRNLAEIMIAKGADQLLANLSHPVQDDLRTPQVEQ